MRNWFLVLATCLFLPALVSPVRADTTETVDFTVTITTGPEKGDVFTGSYSFDATELAATGFAPLITFTFTDPAYAGDSLSSPGWGMFVSTSDGVFTHNPTDLGIFFAPGVGPDDAFSTFACGSPASCEFFYGTTTTVATLFSQAGMGTITFSPVPAPEPGTLTLLGLGLIGLGGIRRRRFST